MDGLAHLLLLGLGRNHVSNNACAAVIPISFACLHAVHAGRCADGICTHAAWGCIVGADKPKEPNKITHAPLFPFLVFMVCFFNKPFPSPPLPCVGRSLPCTRGYRPRPCRRRRWCRPCPRAACAQHPRTDGGWLPRAVTTSGYAGWFQRVVTARGCLARGTERVGFQSSLPCMNNVFTPPREASCAAWPGRQAGLQGPTPSAKPAD